MQAPSPIVLNFKPYQKNTLVAFFDVELSSGMRLCGCTLHTKNGHWWIGLPAKPYTKEDGSQSWCRIVDFREKATHERFQQIVTPLARAALEQATARGAA
jgi:hypothetical protein